MDGNWQKHFKFYDFLGSLRFTMETDGTLLYFKQYAAFGKTTLDTLGSSRQGIYKLRIDNGKLTMKRQENIAIYTNYNCHLSIVNCQFFKFYDYLGSLRFTMKTDGTLLNFKQYAAFGETTLDTHQIDN